MLKLDDTQKRIILKKMTWFYSELIARYESKKYNETKYEKLLKKFGNPTSVKNKDIEKALAWKYGKTRNNVLKNKNYNGILTALKKHWPSYIKKNISNGEETFLYFYEFVVS